MDLAKLQFIPEAELVVPANRQRLEFLPEEIEDLKNSIKAHGLLNPITTREGNRLVAGERRIRAIRDMWFLDEELRCGGQIIPKGLFPCLDLGALSELEAEEAECEENIRRLDLTWAERAAATERLSRLRAAQAEAAGLPAPTTSTIALEVRGEDKGHHHEATRREIIVAKHLADPEVKAAKSLDEAFKVLKRKEEHSRNTSLAAEVGRTFSAEVHRLYHGEAAGLLVGLASEAFDVILTDPPYGMGADEFGDSNGKAAGAHSYTDSKESWTSARDLLAVEGFRLAKPQAHLYCFLDIDNFIEAREVFSAAGWWVHRTPLIWFKPSGARMPWPEHGPQRKYETILYAVKGKRPVLRVAGDVISCNTDPNLGHQAQKPVGLLTDLLSRSVRPGDYVLDPFCGTGSTIVAAHGLKCRGVGIEIDAASYGIALSRLQKLSA